MSPMVVKENCCVDAKNSEADLVVPEQVVFGKVIEGLRNHLDMSQSELSNGSGISKAALSRLERGESNPSLSTILALARGLRLSPHEVLHAYELAMENTTSQLAQATGGTFPKAAVAAGLAALAGAGASRALMGSAGIMGLAINSAIGTGVFSALVKFLKERDRLDDK